MRAGGTTPESASIKHIRTAKLRIATMQQMNIPDDIRVEIDLTSESMPRTIRTLLPAVYKEGDSYCCLLGPDPEQGIFACGNTPESALSAWEEQLRKRIIDADENDEVATYAKDA